MNLGPEHLKKKKKKEQFSFSDITVFNYEYMCV